MRVQRDDQGSFRCSGRSCTVIAAALLLVLEGACVHPGVSDTETNAARRRPGRDSREFLAAAEVAEHPTLRTATAYDAVRRLRPEYLATVSVDADRLEQSSATVFVDGVPRGGLEILRTIPTTLVVEIRFVRPSDSAVRYGQVHRWGAILVTTKKR